MKKNLKGTSPNEGFMPKKKRVTAYVPEEIHEGLIKEVLARVNKRAQFRGIVSECITEALELWLRKKQIEQK